MKKSTGEKTVVHKIPLGLETRDGEIMLVRDDQDQCYLVAEAGTFHNPEVFKGLGSTEQIKITLEAFYELAYPGGK
jgi:hypothetical protein